LRENVLILLRKRNANEVWVGVGGRVGTKCRGVWHDKNNRVRSDIFWPDLAQYFLIAKPTAIENRIRINRTLRKFFRADLD
jgi:hypothetical protein